LPTADNGEACGLVLTVNFVLMDLISSNTGILKNKDWNQGVSNRAGIIFIGSIAPEQ
jgi:hypothetical protein